MSDRVVTDQDVTGLIVDCSAVPGRKPRAGPLVEPSEAIAIALSIVRYKPGDLLDPDGRVVQLVLRALREAGWKIEPR